MLEKVACEKPDQVLGPGYLSGRYDKDRSTPLSSKSRVSTNKIEVIMTMDE